VIFKVTLTIAHVFYLDIRQNIAQASQDVRSGARLIMTAVNLIVVTTKGQIPLHYLLRSQLRTSSEHVRSQLRTS